MSKQIARRVSQAIPDHSDAPMVMVTVDEIIPWDGNPRQNDEAAKRLAVLIQAHGFVNPVIIWSGNGVMYAGHTRVKAAKLLGMTHVPARCINFASEQHAIAFGIADNKANEWASWDEPGLVEQLNNFDGTDLVDVSRMTGLDQGEIEGIGKWKPEEKSPAEPKEPRVIACPHCGGHIVVE